MGFNQEAVELVGEDWARIEPFNEVLERLKKRKLTAIKPEGDAARSKVVWKIIGFEQVILYRIVMLADGCADAWNAHNPLASVLCARAVIEATAIALDFEEQLARFCNQRDFDAIDNLVMNRTFSTRLKHWLEGDAGVESINVLTIINKLDKKIRGVRAHYDGLSEICHPNYLGHYAFFGSLDTARATLHLSDRDVLIRKLLVTFLVGSWLLG